MKLTTRPASLRPTSSPSSSPSPRPAPAPVPRGPRFGESSFEAAGPSARDVAQRLGGPVLEPRAQAVSQDITRFMPPQRAVGLAGPERAASFDFQGQRAPADRYEVVVDGRHIPVVLGHGRVEAGMQQGDVVEIARALGRLPPEALREIREVHLSPFRNPQDAQWAARFGNPGFRSDMTNSLEGIVRVYPRPTDVNDDFIAATLMHESAHTWSQREWGTNPSSPQWQAWARAGQADGAVPSDYATESVAEDLSETNALYLATRGTGQYDAYRAQYPNRFAILEQHFGHE